IEIDEGQERSRAKACVSRDRDAGKPGTEFIEICILDSKLVSHSGSIVQRERSIVDAAVASRQLEQQSWRKSMQVSEQHLLRALLSVNQETTQNQPVRCHWRAADFPA